MTNSFENFYDTYNKEESNEKKVIFLKLTLLALVFYIYMHYRSLILIFIRLI